MKMEGLLVEHKTLGTGTVTKFDGKFLTISFESKVSMFQYPVAFTSFIQAADPADQAAILQEIEDAKAAVIAQQKAAEEAKRAEIERQVAEAAAKKAAPKSTSTPKKAAPKQERIAGKPMTFFVFQNSTFDREYQGGYLWAPVTNKTGDSFHHWDRLLDVHPGDVILHGYNGYVQAVSVARAACYDCVQPQELRTEDSWDMDAGSTPITLCWSILLKPLTISTISSDCVIRNILPSTSMEQATKDISLKSTVIWQRFSSMPLQQPIPI